MADNNPQVGVAKIAMWQAIMVAIITAAASVFTTLAVQHQPQKTPAEAG